MDDPKTRFRVNGPEVIFEDFEDEVVVINFEGGNYYSLEGAGAEIWGQIVNRASGEEIVNGISARYSGGREDIEGGVRQFIAELEREKLIVPDGAADAPGPQDKGAPGPAGADRPDFQVPKLSKYDDMQDLIMLDPIHEVDEAGWPSAKPPGEKKR